MHGWPQAGRSRVALLNRKVVVRMRPPRTGVQNPVRHWGKGNLILFLYKMCISEDKCDTLKKTMRVEKWVGPDSEPRGQVD